MVTLAEYKPSQEQLELFHGLLIRTDCGKAGIFTGISATDDQIKRYADALYECSLRLIDQNPKAIVLPIRGGAVLGWDVRKVAYWIASAQGRYFSTYPIEIEATGILRDKRVDEQVEEELGWYYQKSESFCLEDEKRRRSGILPRLDDLTVIDTVYTGMGYNRLLKIISKVLPHAKVNGIIVQDDLYDIDISFFRQKHKKMGNGDFFYARAPLIFEDQPTIFHRAKEFELPCYFYIPTMGYSVVRDKVLKHVFQKEPLASSQLVPKRYSQ